MRPPTGGELARQKTVGPAVEPPGREAVAGRVRVGGVAVTLEVHEGEAGVVMGDGRVWVDRGGGAELGEGFEVFARAAKLLAARGEVLGEREVEAVALEVELDASVGQLRRGDVVDF